MEIGIEMSTEVQPKNSIGWTELSALKAKALSVLNDALDEGSARDKMQAAILVKSMDDTNVKVEEFRDKQRRLDSGQPTDITDSISLGEAAMGLLEKLNQIKSQSTQIEKISTDNNLLPDRPEHESGSLRRENGEVD